MSKPVLQVEDLSISLDSPERIEIVSELSLEIGAGEILGVVGESGSGKTVVALSIMGLLTPPLIQSSGRIRLQGQDLGQLSSAELNRLRGDAVSMVFQEPALALNPLLRVGDQIREVITAHREISRREARRKTLEMMQMVGLPRVEQTYRQYPHELSGGMRQRVIIAGALICRPKLLIADEPTTALDVTIQAEILQLLRQLRDDFQLAILYITHDLAVVAELCDRVLVLYAGQGIEEGPVSGVLGQPFHPYTEGLLQSLPRMEGQGTLGSIPGAVPQPGTYPIGCRFHPRCRYVKEECRTESQRLLSPSADRRVRCWRADELSLEGLDPHLR